MSDKEQEAYDWATGQCFQSVAACYARTLAHYANKMRAENEQLRDSLLAAVNLVSICT